MRQTIFHRALLLVILACSHGTRAQIDTSFSKINISYPDYLGLVGKNNLNYIAQQFNLSIAEAGIEMAKVLPDPQVMLGYFNNGQQRMKTGYGFNVNMGYTIELGGKRRARIHLASSQAELTKALLDDYFRNLRADATLGYLLAMSRRNAFGVQLLSLIHIWPGSLTASSILRKPATTLPRLRLRRSGSMNYCWMRSSRSKDPTRATLSVSGSKTICPTRPSTYRETNIC